MMRWIVLFTVVVALLASFAVYPIKYDSQELQKEIHRLKRDIEQERINIDILRAEWSFLTRPERLKKLAKKNLSLHPIGVESQGFHIEDLPFRSEVEHFLEGRE